ncbi:TPA: prophage tail fiber N-terminal domain-containing protein [Escherichia coli]|nr:prophage tail fiber N-terminal domain-containing protein [Escherichia coli]
MSVLISGVLTDGAGLPMSGYHIILKARQNTAAVVMRTVATVVTGPAGEYAFEAQTGRYDVYLRSCIEREYCVGDISVYDDSRPGTLNDFLTALDEGDLKPDVVKRFEELVAQAQQSAEAAAESERQAGQHAADAQKIKGDCQTLADNVQQNTNAVEENTQRVEQLASQVEDTAEEVRQDAEAAKQAASDAEQARDDIDVALSATLKTANHLSEIAAEGEDAQQKSRDNLGLKSAATMDVQTDIYDRTEGRLAIPGAFGYGAIFRSEKSFSSENGPTEFVEWVKSTNPGQYAVTQYGSVNRYNPIIKGVVFMGIVDIKIPNTVASNASPDSRTKVVTFYGVNGEVYHTRCAGRPLPEWRKLNLTGVDFADVLSSRVAPTSIGSPDVGGLILAAYQGTADGDTNISMTRGYAYPGSSLTPLSISIPNDRENVATATPLITTRGCRGWSLPGVYIALNGAAGSVRGDSALVGLFVRAA